MTSCQKPCNETDCPKDAVCRVILQITLKDYRKLTKHKRRYAKAFHRWVEYDGISVAPRVINVYRHGRVVHLQSEKVHRLKETR